MKKNLLFMMLSISVLFLSQPSSLFASENSEVRVMESENLSEDEDPFVSAAKHFGGQPNDNGYKLVKTNTIGGLKCEHYVFDNEEYRIFYNKIGDYITIPEDKDGFDVEPEERIHICGVFKLHFKEGIFEGGFDLTNRNDVMKTTYKNGNIKYDVMRNNYRPWFSWQDFKEVNYVGSTYRQYMRADLSIGSGYVLLNKPNEVFVEEAWKKEWYGYWDYKGVNNFWDISGGILIGKRIYSVNSIGSVEPVGYLFKNYAIPCLASDSIVSFNGKDYNNYQIKYANGDSLEARDRHVYGILHRDSVFIRFNGDDRNEKCRVKYADGSVFAGSLWCYDKYGESMVHSENILTLEKYYLHTGTLRFPDGRSYRYESGKSEIEIKALEEARMKAEEARMKEEEAKKKEQEAYNKAVYDAVCKKFGKRYVDAAAQGKIIIGMPEELFKATFKCSVKKREANRVCYYVYGLGVTNYTNRTTITNRVNQVVWVTNGKVSSITNR